MQRGLAFSRAKRLRTAAEFLEGMTPRKLPVASLVVAIAAGVLLLVTSSMLMMSYMQRSRLEGLTRKLQSTDATVVAGALTMLRQYPPGERAPVLLNDAVQANLVNYYIHRAHEAFDVAAGHYDYAAAVAGLKEAQSLSKAYEDSRQLTDALDHLDAERKAEILRQADLFESQLKQGTLIASQGANNVRSTLAVIRQLDPQHPLLSDKRLPIAFADQVRSNIDSDHLALAGALLTAGLQFAPGDAALMDLQDRIARQQSVAQLSAQTGGLEQAVRPLGAEGVTLKDFRTLRPQLEALRRAQPDSAVLLAAQDQLGRLIGTVVSTAVQNRQVAEAQATLNEFSDLLPMTFVAKQRAQIASVTGDTQTRDIAIAQLRAKVEKETLSPQSDDVWVATLKRDLQSLQTLSSADPAIETARSRTNQAYLTQSQSLLSSSRLTESQRFLDLAVEGGELLVERLQLLLGGQ